MSDYIYRFPSIKPRSRPVYSTAGDSTIPQHQWRWPLEALDETPSQRKGMSRKIEYHERGRAVNWIVRASIGLQLPQLIIATAASYLHRFYMRKPMQKYPPKEMSATALFLATKVEEVPRKLEYVVKEFLKTQLSSSPDIKLDATEDPNVLPWLFSPLASFAWLRSRNTFTGIRTFETAHIVLWGPPPTRPLLRLGCRSSIRSPGTHCQGTTRCSCSSSESYFGHQLYLLGHWHLGWLQGEIASSISVVICQRLLTHTTLRDVKPSNHCCGCVPARCGSTCSWERFRTCGDLQPWWDPRFECKQRYWRARLDLVSTLMGYDRSSDMVAKLWCRQFGRRLWSAKSPLIWFLPLSTSTLTRGCDSLEWFRLYSYLANPPNKGCELTFFPCPYPVFFFSSIDAANMILEQYGEAEAAFVRIQADKVILSIFTPSWVSQNWLLCRFMFCPCPISDSPILPRQAITSTIRTHTRRRTDQSRVITTSWTTWSFGSLSSRRIYSFHRGPSSYRIRSTHRSHSSRWNPSSYWSPSSYWINSSARSPLSHRSSWSHRSLSSYRSLSFYQSPSSHQTSSSRRMAYPWEGRRKWISLECSATETFKEDEWGGSYDRTQTPENSSS